MSLAAQQIFPALAVGDLVGAVLPDLAQQEGAGLRLVHDGPDLFDEPVRQLVRHIQPPAVGPGPEPVPHHGVGILDNVVHIGERTLLHGGQSLDAPPGVVVLRPGMEVIPIIPGGVLALGGAYRGIEAVVIEIDALGAGVVEDAIQNYPNAPLVGFPAQLRKVLLRAQHGVHMEIIRRVVPVIGGGLKNGAQVQRGHRQGLQQIQLGTDALQAAAEEIPVSDLTVRVRPPLGMIGPPPVDPPVSHHSPGIGNGQAAETIWKYLVSNTLAEPGGRLQMVAVDRQLPAHRIALAAVAGLVQEAAGAILSPEAEVVPDQLRLFRGGKGQGKADTVAVRAGPGQLGLHGLFGEFMDADQRAVVEILPFQGADMEGHGGSRCHGAVGRLALVTAGIKDKRFTHLQKSFRIGMAGERSAIFRKGVGKKALKNSRRSCPRTAAGLDAMF